MKIPAGAALFMIPLTALGRPGADPWIAREGYQVRVIADLPGARFLEFDDRGNLYVSRDNPGDITTFRPGPDGSYQKLATLVKDRPSCHGLCFKDGWLWFTTSGAVHRARDTDGDGVADENVDVVTGLPRGGHWWRSILVTDDGFYTSIGDSGNTTDEARSDRQKIWKYALDGKTRSLFCSGIRNTEKLRIRPGTSGGGEIWGLDHGSDWFGRQVGDIEGDQPVTDLNPPDEFNRYVKGGFYGHPFIVGNRLPRYEYMERNDIHRLAATTIPPEWPVGAHWATNGFCFIDPAVNQKSRAFPADHEGDAFIACHGSWNSSKPVGYCIARIRFDNDPTLGGHPSGLEKIVSFIDDSGQVRGRPADCAQAPDGSIIFSSDSPGRLYRITHAAPK